MAGNTYERLEGVKTGWPSITVADDKSSNLSIILIRAYMSTHTKGMGAWTTATIHTLK